MSAWGWWDCGGVGRWLPILGLHFQRIRLRTLPQDGSSRGGGSDVAVAVGQGAACTGDAQCSAHLYCVSGECQPPGAVGAAWGSVLGKVCPQ